MVGKNINEKKSFPLKSMQKDGVAPALKNFKHIFIIVALNLLLLTFVFADNFPATPPLPASHPTLYSDTITSKTDASPVSIADSQGLFVTGDITTLGNVGIGTTNPGQKLEIAGNIQLTGGARQVLLGNGQGMVDDGGANLKLGSAPGTRVYLAPGGTDTLTALPSGNVGIGTTGPGYCLDVVSDSYVRIGTKTNIGNFLYLNKYSSATSNNLVFQTAGTINARIRMGDGVTNRLDIDDGTTGNERLSIRLDTGNVGIGTTSPAQKLHIKGGDNTGLQINGSDYGGGYIKITGRDQSIGGTVSSFYHTIDVKMKTQGDNAGNGVETTIMQLFKEGWGGGDIVSFPRGNVGIGYTDTSGNKLAVNGAIYSSSSITAASQFCFPGDCRNSWASVGGGPWATSGNNIYNTNSGNVGIGTTGPTSKLQIGTLDTSYGSAILGVFNGETTDSQNQYPKLLISA